VVKKGIPPPILLIILFQCAGAYGQDSGALTVSQAKVTGQGNYCTITVPNYLQIKFGDGSLQRTITDNQGVVSVFDLKNDPSALYDYGSGDVGLFEMQWGLKNSDGSVRHPEYKEGPGTVTILEQNNVRVRLRYEYAVRPYGSPQYAPDCCLTATEYFTIYRPDKIFQRFDVAYTGRDGKGPLSINGAVILKLSDMKAANMSTSPLSQMWVKARYPCEYFPPSGIPWEVAWLGPPSQPGGKSWILLAASRTGSGVPPPHNFSGCSGGKLGVLPADPGNIHVCRIFGCTDFSFASVLTGVVHLNALRITNGATGTYRGSADDAVWFLGGRYWIQGALACRRCIAAGDMPYTVIETANYLGDNGITNATVADAYAREYQSPPKPRMIAGTSQGYSQDYGDYEMTAVSGAISFSIPANKTTPLHNPAFSIQQWTGPVPTTVVVNGSALNLNSGYVANTSGSRLLVQLLGTYSGMLTFQAKSAGPSGGAGSGVSRSSRSGVVIARTGRPPL